MNKDEAFAYQVKVCEQIRKEFPDAYFGPGFAANLPEENKDLTEAWERLKKDYPDAQPYSLMFTPGLPEYGNGRNVAGWRAILYAQRRELEGKG